MAKMTGFKYFNGTKAAFESKASQYADAIVFISGGADSKGSCIFAQGMYFGNFAEFLATINYVKGVRVGDSQYNATAGGGYIPFAAAANSEVSLNVENGTITVGLTTDFVNKVNNTASDLGSKNDGASSTGSAFARIANLAAIVGQLTGSEGGELESVEGQITKAINALRTEITGDLSDTTDAKTIEAINDELNGLDAKVKSLEDAGFIKIGDVTAEIAKLGGGANGGTNVKVTVASQGGEVSSVTVDETVLTTVLNGKADLDESGKILASQFPDYILGQLLFGGTVEEDNAIQPSANAIAKYGEALDTDRFEYLPANDYEGLYFITVVPFTYNDIHFEVGDWILSNGNEWVKIDNTDAVASVAGLSGTITASALAQKLAETGDANELALKSEVDAVEVTASGDNTLITASVSNKRAVSVAPTEKLTNAVAKAETAYQKPADGIAKTDLASDVQTSLGKADSSVQEVEVYSGGEVMEAWIENSQLTISLALATEIASAEYRDDNDVPSTKAIADYVDSQWEWEVIS